MYMKFNLKVKLADNSANNLQEFSFTSNIYNEKGILSFYYGFLTPPKNFKYI